MWVGVEVAGGERSEYMICCFLVVELNKLSLQFCNNDIHFIVLVNSNNNDNNADMRE